MEHVSATINITDNGDLETGLFNVSLLIDGREVSNTTVGSILPGEEVVIPLTSDYQFDAEGLRTLKVVAYLPGDNYQEDNTGTTQVYVFHQTIAEFVTYKCYMDISHVSPGGVVGGTYANLGCTVANLGDAPATGVSFTVTEVTGRMIYEDSVDLDAGEVTDIIRTIDLSNVVIGTIGFDGYAGLNMAGIIPESNYDNNDYHITVSPIP
jgi:hypothetical protein